MLEKIATSLDTEVANLLNIENTTIYEVANNTGTLSAQGINTTLNLHIPTEAIEEIKKLFVNK